MSVALFTSLIISKSLSGLYSGSLPEFELRAFILDRVIEANLPKLFSHFKKHGVRSNMFATQWLITFFSGYFQTEMAATVLDNFVLEGWPALYRISVALLRLFEPDLLQASEFHELIQTVSSMNQPDPRHSILFAVAANEVLPEELGQYELDYFIDQVQSKLQGRDEWTKLDQKLLPSLATRLA